MRVPRADDTELMDAVNRYVTVEEGSGARYLKLLHGGFAGGGERDAFLRSLVRAAAYAGDRELGVLLESDWRSRLTAAWLIGAGRRAQFRERLGDLLLESRLTFAGQGYCLALAQFGTPADAAVLATYLDRYLPQVNRALDQPWALGALHHLDPAQAARFARPWEQWEAANHIPVTDVGSLCTLLQEAVHTFHTDEPPGRPQPG